MGAEKLGRKADQLQDTLGLLDRLTTEAGQLLDALGQSLYELTDLTAPIHARATALTAAQANVAETKKAVDELLEHLDTSRRVRCHGPKQAHACLRLCPLHCTALQCSQSTCMEGHP
jgi:hypothetical protein